MEATARRSGIAPLDLFTFSGQLTPLEYAILATVAYADVFDYPLTLLQLHRYLHSLAAELDEIRKLLDQGGLVPGNLSLHAGFVTLPGREHLVDRRLHARGLAARLIPHAAHYGKQLGRLPFVRMVALTGSLAMENVADNADFDYFILAQSGRLWTCRAACLLLRRAAKLRGYSLCPNFIVSTDRLVLHQRDIYTAHELTQMIPLAGLDLYWELRRLNAWSDEFLPNSLGLPTEPWVHSLLPAPEQKFTLIKNAAELMLHHPIGDRLEGWEMRRKIQRFEQRGGASLETFFSADWCQGHFDRHGERTLLAYRQRLENLPAPSTSDIHG